MQAPSVRALQGEGASFGKAGGNLSSALREDEKRTGGPGHTKHHSPAPVLPGAGVSWQGSSGEQQHKLTSIRLELIPSPEAAARAAT